VVEQPFWLEADDPRKKMWESAMKFAESIYMDLIAAGAKPQEARSVLPNSLKTEVVVSANFREWRHIFRMRTSTRAHPQMREVMVPLLHEIQHKPNLGLLFEDIHAEE
jgi:thymidylate synthase (FAD)